MGIWLAEFGISYDQEKVKYVEKVVFRQYLCLERVCDLSVSTDLSQHMFFVNNYIFSYFWQRVLKISEKIMIIDRKAIFVDYDLLC